MMAAGDTWVAKIEGSAPPKYIRARAYNNTGALVEEFTIEMPEDDYTLQGEENGIGVIVRDNTFCCCSAYYFYTVKLDTDDTYVYKYAPTAGFLYWYTAFNNGKFSFVVIDTTDSEGWRNAYFDSPDGIVWTKQIDYDDFDPDRYIYSMVYSSYDGKYWCSMYDPSATNPCYIDREYTLEWTIDFTTFVRVGDYRPYFDLNAVNDAVYFRYLDSDESTVFRLVKYSLSGAATEYTPTGLPSGLVHVAEAFKSVYNYGTVNVTADGTLYALIAEYDVSSSDYVSTGIYEYNGATFARTGVVNESYYQDFLWPISNYRVAVGDNVVAVKNYDVSEQGTTIITSIYNTPQQIPRYAGATWLTYYLETGAGVESSFWCEYDDCQETTSDY